MRLYVCACQGQRSKKHQWSINRIRYPTLVQPGFGGVRLQPIRFRGPQNSANQVLRSWEVSQSDFGDLGIRKIRFRGPRNSANQVLRIWNSRQSGFEQLETQPIRFRGTERLANQALSGRDIR